jgi:hypothetical protein
VEFPEETARIVGAARAFEEVTPVRGILIALRISPDGTVVGRRVGELDGTSTVTECQRIDLLPTAAGRQWPYLQIAYRSVHRADQWVGGITWTAIFDTTDMSVVRRVPVAYWRRSRDGKESGDVIVTTSLSSSELQLKGRVGGKQWTYRCSGGCRVPAEEILATP